MKRNKFALAATSGLVGLSVLAGSMAYAAGNSDAKSAEELRQFLTANPEVAAVVGDVETKTGGKVMEAEFDDETQGNGVVEFEVVMADGSEQDILYTLADNSMTVNAEDQDDDDGDDDAETDDDAENEANDDK
ncbi:hypothetical protein [Sulfitobacter sp. BSw21498]|uniref:hypothetical protein n=1 Tax=Sulfitobacter sp. BSw21498 TaxID=664426 RepID=UPI0020C798A3|nr:hypothetical protein [Sulfitobacter sp. BSw21498]